MKFVTLRYILSAYVAYLTLVASGVAGNNPVATSSLTGSWEGMADSSGIRPPDPHGSAGPNGILQVVNQRLAYWTKAGAIIWGPTPFATFFPWASNAFQSDPRALYDPEAHRFYVEILEIDFAGNHSYIDFAVSKSSNPSTSTTNDWLFYRMENTRILGGQTFWGDYSALAFDAQAIYVSLNLYSFLGETNGDSQITVMSKSALFNGNTNYALVTIPGGPEAAFTLQPCTVIGTNNPGNVAYFGETFPGANSPTNIRVWALSDPLGARTLSSALVTIPDNGGPPLAQAPQPATSATVDPMDGRAQGNAFWNNGSIWFCNTAGGSSGRCQVYYYQVNLNGFPLAAPTLGLSGAIDGGPGMWTYQPSIGGNSPGDVCIVYTESSLWTYPTIRFTVLAAGSPAFEVPSILKISPAYSSSGRWGDYGSVSVDPVDSSFWITHEWANSTNDYTWSTWWGHVAVGTPPPTTLQLSSAISSASGFQFTVIGQSGASYVVQSSTNPGSGTWISLKTNVSPFVFTDTNTALVPQRFYRAMSAP
jgi:hypothetical protein